jgi:metal-responsive CopG/Arc/MetJ family transcriptional regulator
MATKRKTASKAAKTTARMSVSLPAELHRTLEQLAKTQKVSLSWIIRDAAEKYVSDRWPLLAGKG